MSEFPDNWIEAIFRDLAEARMGATILAKELTHSGTPVYSAGQKNVRWGFTRKTVSAFGLGTIVVSARGSIGFPKLPREIEFTCTQTTIAVSPNNEIDTRYFKYVLEGVNWKKLASGASIPMLTISALSELTVPVAPKQEQKRIADKLDTMLARVDACRDRLDRIPAILKRFRQSVLAAATSGKLTEEWRAERVGWADEGSPTNEAEEPRWASQAQPNLRAARDSAQLRYAATGTPDSATLHPGYEWSVTTLGKCGAVSGGITKNGKRSALSLRKPYLRVANVYANRLALDDVTDIGLTEAEHSKTRLVAGDLLIVEGNGSLDQLGRVALWRGELDDCVHQNHLIRWRTAGPLPKLVLYWLMSPRGRNDLMKLASTTTGLHTLSISKVSAVPIELPTLAEQTEIVRRVESLFAYADRLEARYAAARAQVEKLTPATLAKAFRGELVPQDPRDEPASALRERIRAQRGEQAANKPKRGRKAAV